MSEIKPCPFCGSDAARVFPPTCTKATPYNPGDRAFPEVRCPGCYASVGGKDWDQTGDTAVAAWNCRTPSTSAAPGDGPERLHEGVASTEPAPSDRGAHAMGEARHADTVAKIVALFDEEFGYSISLTRLVDGESTYTLTVEGDLIGEFPGYDEASERLREIKLARRVSAAEQIVAALSPAPPITAGNGSGEGWQTIDSAPKDGTLIDVWCPAIGRCADVQWVPFVEDFARAATIEGEPGWQHWPNSPPTHWRPRPDPPAALAPSGGALANTETPEHADGSERYRDFDIHYDPPPIPSRNCDWHWTHKDFDGPEDNRGGHAPSLEAAKAEIDFWHEENDQ